MIRPDPRPAAPADAEALARRIAEREEKRPPVPLRRVEGDDGSEAELFEDVPV